MPDRPLRVMADTNVLISGVIFPRAAYEFLQHALQGDFTLVLSEQILAEVQYWMQTKATHLQRAAMTVFLEEVPCEVVPDPPRAEVERHFQLVRDSKDVPIALAAIQAGVDYLVSHDQDLVAQDETTATLRLWLSPMPVVAFLRDVMGWSPEELEAIRHRTWEEIG
ncbi:MAG: putative toxin-antitoxin system toxin component, PIN family [Chloroflexi bacterium]|nr:putative toxin-antitoxin system toxin component, PIN family [Chloroflexota bacterium]